MKGVVGMGSKPGGGNPSGFLWLGILILLPLGVLTALGIYAIRRDRLSVEGEARQRAQEFAEEQADRFWHSLTNWDLMTERRMRILEEPRRNAFTLTIRSNPPALPLDTGLRGHGSFMGTSIGYVIRISKEGKLVFPQPYSLEAKPRPLDLSRLNPAQRQQWLALQDELENRSKPEAADQWREFLATHPPDAFAAQGHYRLGLLLEDAPSAKEEFRLVLEQYPESLSESGVSLPLLAKMQLTRMLLKENGAGHADNWGILNEFFQEIVRRRGPLTPLLVEQVDQWKKAYRVLPEFPDYLQEWEKIRFQLHGQLINFHLLMKSISNTAHASTSHGANSDPAASGPAEWPEWIRISSERKPEWSRHGGIFLAMLAIRQPSPEAETYQYFLCYVWEDQVVMELSEQERGLPAYLGVRYRWGGGEYFFGQNWRRWRDHQMTETGRSIPARDEPAPRALYISRRSPAGKIPLLEVEVSLVNPAALYRQHQQRAWWFGGLLALSTGAAGIGLWAAWRAIQRQQHLIELQSNFVSSVSHELRAPIAAVRMMAETLEEGLIEEPARQRQYFRYIVQECRRLSTMVANVLDFARIEQNRKEYEFVPTDVGRLVEDTTRAMEAYAREKQVGLALQLSWVTEQPDLDGRAIQQAMVNLIDNAIKHSLPGRAVTVGLERVDQELRLWVADQGPGIPPEDHSRIFERFYRRGSELRRETAGVGIGLSIVKHIVDAHGGRVWVESQLGQGSRFVMELPLAAPTVEPTTSIPKADHDGA